MTVTNPGNDNILDGDGSTTAFGFTFQLPVGSTGTDIYVYVIDNLDNVTLITSNLTLDLNAKTVTYPVVGGISPLASGVNALPAGWRIAIYRIESLTQALNLATQGPFPAIGLMAALDYLTLLDQQQQEQINRSLKFPITEVAATLPGIVTRANKFLAFDSSGNPVASSGGFTFTGVALGAIPEVVDSIAALKALVVTPTYTTYIVRGYLTAGDGGDGVFIWNASDARADNGGTIIAPNSGTGRWNRLVDGPVNVQWFGALNDGVTEVSSQIQKAINAAATLGGVVYFPAGSYYINSAVTLASNIMLIGQGDASVILLNGNYLTGSSKNNIVMRDLKISPYSTTTPKVSLTLCNKIRIFNVTFDGRIGGTNVLGSSNLTLNGCVDVLVDACRFYDANDMIYLDASAGTNSDRVVIRNSHFEHTNGHGTFYSFPVGIYQYKCDYLLVDGCSGKDILQGAAAAGHTSYLVYEGDGSAVETVVVNCKDIVTENTTKPHIMVSSSLTANVRVMNSSLRMTNLSSTGGFFCQLIASEGIQCIGNYAYNCVYRFAISAVAVKTVIVENNYSSKSPQHGIRFGANGDSVATIICRGNYIHDCAFAGIYVNYCTKRFYITNNVVIDANTANAAAVLGTNEDRIACIAVSNATLLGGIVSGNYGENTIGGSGHAKYGYANSTTANAIDVRPDNTFLRMDTAATSRGITPAQRPGQRPFYTRGQIVYYTEPVSGSCIGEVCTDNRRTTIDVLGEASGQTVISVTSAAGMAIGDCIALLQDNGTYLCTTIDNIVGNDVTIHTALTANAAAGNDVVTNRFALLTGSILEGSAVYDPGNLVDGAGVTTTVTVTGAAVGDFAEASLGVDLQGITMTAWVSATDTVSVRLQNESGGALDLASSTLRARVRKQTA